jgi:very-short-patch-repair endonuclease
VYDDRSAPRSIDDQIARIARGQHGLVTHAQLSALMSRTAIAYRVRVGRLHVVHPKVFAVGHASLSREARWHAAVLAVGPGAALSHLPAAILWNIWKWGTGEGINVVAAGEHRNVRGLEIHTSRSLIRRDVQRRDGIPVTTVARTVLDLGDVLSKWRLANVLHEAEFRRRLNRRAIADVLRRTSGRHAATILREALALNEHGSAGAKSELEETFAIALERAGLVVRLNLRVPVGEGDAIEVDLHWPEAMLVVEVDGSPHARSRTRREDRVKEILLRDAGWEVARFGPVQESQCISLVRARLAGAVTGT